MAMWTDEHERRHEELRLLMERIRGQYRGRPGLVGMSVGFKSVAGGKIPELAVRFHVLHKGNVSPADLLPKEIGGAKTDVVETRMALEAGLKEQLVADFGPPDGEHCYNVVGGISIGLTRDSATGGTLGVVVLENGTNRKMMLSNRHVLCGKDGKETIGANNGDQICQPSRMLTWLGTASSCARVVQARAGSYPENPVGGEQQYGMDAAVAVFGSWLRKATAGQIKDVGQVVYSGTINLRPSVPGTAGTIVRKRGRTSKLTSGEVDSVTYATNFDFGGKIGNREMQNQIIVVPSPPAEWFSADGDSGAVYLADNPATGLTEVVALHWAGTWPDEDKGGESYGSPIGPIFEQLNVYLPNPS
jgi:hypothetical protein